MNGKIVFIFFLILPSLSPREYSCPDWAKDIPSICKYDHAVGIYLTLICHDKPYSGVEVKLEEFYDRENSRLKAKSVTDGNGFVKLTYRFIDSSEHVNFHALVKHNCTTKMDGKLQSFFITFSSQRVDEPTSSIPMTNLHTFELSKTGNGKYYPINQFENFTKEGIIIKTERKEDNEDDLVKNKGNKISLFALLTFVSKISKEKVTIIKSS